MERPFKLNRLLETRNDPTVREFTNLFNFHFTLNLSLCAQSQKMLTSTVLNYERNIISVIMQQSPELMSFKLL